MRLIQEDKNNPKPTLSVSWMWLPMFIAQNQQLLGELDHVLSVKFPPPFEVTEVKLDEIHGFIVEWICNKIKVPGLDEYLKAIENVKENSDEG